MTTPAMPWPARLAAVDAGARQMQGTLNGLGERCGNANLTTLIPTLAAERRPMPGRLKPGSRNRR
jgi:2-isopropylmalate synthase